MKTVLLIITIVLLTIVIVRLLLRNKESNLLYEEKIKKLSEEKNRVYDEIENNKAIYTKDRQILLAQHEAESIDLKHSKEKLAEFTKEKRAYYAEMDNLSSHNKVMTPEELIELRAKVDIPNSRVLDFTGIYILENKTMDKYYVGQSITVIRRCAKHFMEKGNKDIYEDYMNGEKWTIQMIALSNSGFKSINALEKHFIDYYHSTYNGYNKTIGNRT